MPPDGIPGGTGKTTAALALVAHLSRKRIHQGAQVYAKLVTNNDTALAPLQAMREVLVRCFGAAAEKMIQSEASTNRHYQSLFLADGLLHGGTLVLDDAKTEEQIIALLPSAGRTVVIVTSRFTLSLPVACGSLREIVGTLPIPLAVEWLELGLNSSRGYAPSPEDVAQIQRLAELTSGIALALQLIEKRLRKSGKTVRLCDLVARYQRDRQDYMTDLDASLATSFSLLDEEYLRDSLKRCRDRCAVPPRGI